MFDSLRQPYTRWGALFIAALGLLASLFLAQTLSATAQMRPVINGGFEEGLGGWNAPSPDSYTLALDTRIVHGGKASASLTSRTASPRQPGMLLQSISAAALRGKHVRVSGYLRTQSVEWAALFVQTLGANGETLGYQTMPTPLRESNDWQRAVVVLVVPAEAASLSAGVQLAFQGQVWLDDVQIEPVGDEVPLSADLPAGNELAPGALNLGFEAGLDPWGLDANMPWLYTVDTEVIPGPAAHSIAFLRSLPEAKPGRAANLTEWFKADAYRGKRMRFSALVKTDSLADGAGLFLLIDEDNPWQPGPESERPIRGTTDWQRYARVMDVPQDSQTISIGVHMAGSGQVWLDDVRFEPVGSDVPANR